MTRILGSAVGSRAATLALALTIIASACGAATPVSSPSGSAVSGTAAATPAAVTSSSAGTDRPPASGVPPDPGESSSPTPLPMPSLSEPFAIGAALYDPGLVGEGVVSLLDVMGVGIYTQDGTPVRTGAEKKSGDPWLTDDEVRGLIEMGTTDLREGGEDGGPYTLADLHAALAPLLPQLSLNELVAAYQHAYADHPDDLVPQVMLGQPIDVTTPLTRVQLWLLFFDGFVEPADASIGKVVPGALLAQAATGPQWGSANANLPPLANPDFLTFEMQNELLGHLMTIAWTIPFTLAAPSVHEGHGQPGAPVAITASIGAPPPLVSPLSPQLMVTYVPYTDGIPVTWRSDDMSVLRDHGTLTWNLPSDAQATFGGSALIGYKPKREAADGRGLEVSDYASLYATVDVRDLALRVIAGDYPIGWFTTMRRILGSRRTQPEGFVVKWHTRAFYEVTITWSDFWNGVEDTAIFTGVIHTIDTEAIVRDGVVLTGTGTVTGTRAAWAACSVNLDPPDVAGPADFVATVIGDQVTVVAFSVGYPSTEPFTLSKEGGTKTITSTSPDGGSLCPHGWQGTITLTQLNQP